jgi:hypothetical protein
LIQDTGSPPFVVNGDINIGGRSGPVKGAMVVEARRGAC